MSDLSSLQTIQDLYRGPTYFSYRSRHNRLRICLEILSEMEMIDEWKKISAKDSLDNTFHWKIVTPRINIQIVTPEAEMFALGMIQALDEQAWVWFAKEVERKQLDEQT